MKIRDIFSKNIDRKIEEVIKVDQHNEQVVMEELQEYIVTDSIHDHFCTVYEEIAKGPTDPREGIGVWVSGFFGSGKSSFAKILGYTVANREVLGKTAGEIFKEHVKDTKISGYIENITARIPTHAVIFDVSMDRGVRTASERITEIMYKALLRELGYPEDFDLAELEITLEGDGLLEAFCIKFEEIHKSSWQKRRKLGLAVNEASAALHALDPKTYPSEDSWARTIGEGRADITANELAKGAFELVDRRMPGKALIFIIDEVGQYVSRSVDKMLDLQALVQAFGRESFNRVKAKKAPAPYWIVVTSQEKLNEVVDALGSKKIELARLQDRFRILVDLKQSDIAEITGKRVLDKKNDVKDILTKFYDENEGRLHTFCKLERTSRDVSLGKDDFINLYPYLPYQIDLCIDIVSGLRLKRGAHRHIGGSNRTIIKQAQEMMINPRTNLADKPIGTLVTLDLVYELLYLGNLLPTEVTHEIDGLTKILPDNEMVGKVAKAIILLEAVRDLPRTTHNIAAVLHPNVEAESIEKDVNDAIRELERAKLVRPTEDGYKLLTVQEKNWETTRKELDPKDVERNRIKRELIREIFVDPKIRGYRYKNLRPFKAAIFVDGEVVDSDGQFNFNIMLSDDSDDNVERCKEARDESAAKQDQLFWVVTLNDEIHNLVNEIYRSREMVSTHERIAAQGKLTSEEASCLAEEKVRRDRYHRQLRSKLQEVFLSGTGFFRSVQRDGSALGDSLSEVTHKFFDIAVPDLYPKLEMGIRPLKGDEPDAFLKAANLNGLSPIFYAEDNGLSLVVKRGDKYVTNVNAPICREVMDHIKREHSYGNKVSGKALENFFQGVGYGWDRDVLRLVLAVLLRGGVIEVTHQGRKYRNHNDPACRKPFTNNPVFRAASFSLREALDLKLLASAARQYEEMTGKEVDIEESSIATAFQKLAAEDRENLLPLVARMEALDLPGKESLREHLNIVEGIIDMPSDDCVRTLAGEGKSYSKARQRTDKLLTATTEKNLKMLSEGRRILSFEWPVLEEHAIDGDIKAKAQELSDSLNYEEFFDKLETIRLASKAINNQYRKLYEKIHEERQSIYSKALEHIRGLPEWAAISENPDISDEQRQVLLLPLTARCEHELDVLENTSVCKICRTTIDQIETDVMVVEAIRDQVFKRILELAAPDDKFVRLKISNLFSGTLETEEDVKNFLEILNQHLMKELKKGIRIILE